MNIPQLPVDHPWYFLSKHGVPNVKWCEATQHSWVTEPSNTWSNLAYLAIGLLIIKQSKDVKNPFLKFFGLMAVILAFCSGIYHASYNFPLQVLDFFGMYLIFLIPLMINLQRVQFAKTSTLKTVYFASVVGLTALTVAFYYLNVPIQLIVFSLVVGIVATELMANKRSNMNINYKSFKFSMASLGTAATFSALDVTRTVCMPHSAFQGHATWHLFTAICIYFAFRHYKQFEYETHKVGVDSDTAFA